jgi:probable phosphoglycerate mutase
MRHGQTDYNFLNLWMGSTDVPLNSVGVHQSIVAAKKISSVNISKIYVSPLLRARETADIVADFQINKPEIIVVDGFRERCFGAFEGQLKDEAKRVLMADAPDVESLDLFDIRIRQAFSLIDAGKNVLIVSHSAVYRHVLEHFGWCRSAEPASIGNCEFVRLVTQQVFCETKLVCA